MRDDRDDFTAARRALGETISRTQAEDQIIDEIVMSTGSRIRIAWHKEPGRPRVLSIWLMHLDADGVLRPDSKRGLRLHLDELPQLGRAVARALDEAERFARRPEGGRTR